jgi:hypothetical protein
MSYRCAICRKDHEGLPDLGMKYPDPYLWVPESQRAERTTFTPDACTVRDDEGMHYFVRGVIYIPIRGTDDAWGIGAWVSQSQKNFARYVANETMEPTLGWLTNRIESYAPTTYGLEAKLRFSDARTRPRIELEPGDHPLVVEQRDGITLARAWQVVHACTPS